MILVILGHFSELTSRHTFIVWLGFGFRMPMLIGLTGYLFNLDHAREMRLVTLVRHYHRLIIPWLVASIVYVVLVQPVDWRLPLELIVRPPFHLWFVPVMLAFILIAWGCRLRRGQMLAIAVPASIAAMYAFGVGHGIEQYSPWMPDRRYFIYPIYFTYGLWVARRPPDPAKLPYAIIVSLIGLVWWSALYRQPAPEAEVAAELLLCMPLIGMLPRVRRIVVDFPSVANVGRDSLFFYLWHPLIFGLCAAAGLSGLPMLAVTVVLLALGWAGIARVESLRGILGIRDPARSARIGTISPDEALTMRTAA
ncbi:acyltransferase [Sphingomonas sp. AP4-R1]|uniref:acyltransferase family protein n=1 Tax=Sphingomonas sp. AP4-R1 TaxID=2735134 RepID=UPI001493B739|nr:acyltransferase family protein [Sphingomonas sp. AP4-R1]QJU56539.1 acyltransferase [Sphingomonas sp. AP4-R1]